ncbi:MAG TPA: hypothetical protein VFW80_08565 [Gaiellaceae bacterium]|nr:hypothetical protein [Gaiellaceae bacterium]
MSELLTFDPQGGPADTALMRNAYQRIGIGMKMIATVDLDPLTQVNELMHAAGPFLDPTAYRDQLERGDMADMTELVRLLKPAVEHWRSKIAPKLPEDF